MAQKVRFAGFFPTCAICEGSVRMAQKVCFIGICSNRSICAGFALSSGGLLPRHLRLVVYEDKSFH